MTHLTLHFPKYVLGWLLCFAIRLLPYRPANIEPVLTATMPFAKRFGVFGGVFFVVLNMVLYDAFTSGIGLWTWVTAAAYAVVAIGAAWFFKARKGTWSTYALYAGIGTVLFDALTGLTVGPLVYGQPFSEAFFGQIPFTARHLISNVIFAAIASPLIDKWIVQNQRIELGAVFSRSQS